jgi:hypothetical protein
MFEILYNLTKIKNSIFLKFPVLLIEFLDIVDILNHVGVFPEDDGLLFLRVDVCRELLEFESLVRGGEGGGVHLGDEFVLPAGPAKDGNDEHAHVQKSRRP